MKKKILSFVLAILMVVSILPFSAFMALAEPATEPIAKGRLNVSVVLDDYKTEASPDKPGMNWRSNPRKLSINVEYYTDPLFSNGKDKPMEISQAYCINHGATFKNIAFSNYYGYSPADSVYFNSLSETAQKGILLATALGYNGSNPIEWQKLGVTSLEEAIAATQALVWEFNVGSRTSFKGEPIDDWAYSMVRDVEGAKKAYWAILEKAQNFIDKGGDWKTLLTIEGMIVWEQSNYKDYWEEGNGQVVMSYTGTSITIPFGSISVIKTDVNGYKLKGAEFTIYYEESPEDNIENWKIFDKPLTTNENGYAITDGGMTNPIVPYGKYKVVETKSPTYVNSDGEIMEYIPVGPTEWVVTVDEKHVHRTVNATNRKNVEIQIQKSSLDGKYVENMEFGVYDAETNTRLLTLTIGADGWSNKEILPQTTSSKYYWRENSEGPFKCYWVKDGVYIKQSESGDAWTFNYDDAKDNLFEFEAYNVVTPGYGIVKKNISNNTDNSSLADFRFNIWKFGEYGKAGAAPLVTGTTNSAGYFVGGNQLFIAENTVPYTLSQAGQERNSSMSTIVDDSLLTTYFVAAETSTIGTLTKELKKWNEIYEYGLLCNDTSNYSVNTSDGYEQLEADGLFIPMSIDDTTTMDLPGTSMLPKAICYNDGSGWQPLGFLAIHDMNIEYSKYNAQRFLTNWGADSVTIKELIEKFATNENGVFAEFSGEDLAYDYTHDGVIDQQDIAYADKAIADGKTTIENTVIALDPGKYILEEVLTDTQKSEYSEPNIRKFTITENKTTELNFVNQPLGGAIKIVKDSEDGVIEGWMFRVEGTLVNGKTFSIVSTTDANGEIYVDYDEQGRKVIAGEYTITEIGYNGVEGYFPVRYIVPEPQTITITQAQVEAEECINVYFENKLKPVEVFIKKTTDASDGKVGGIKFYVYGYEADGTEFEGTFITDENGIIATKLAPGTYYVKEIQNDDRFVTLDTQVINPHYDEATGTVADNEATFRNTVKKFTLTLVKKDSTGTVHGDCTLAGAVYGLYLNGELVDQQTTDANGELTFEVRELEIGYTVQEISAPKGYYLDSTVYDIDTNPANYDIANVKITLEVEDKPIVGKFSIYKEYGFGEDTKPESGAEFEVYLKSAGSYEAASEAERDYLITSEEDASDNMGYFGGSATTKELPYGTYVVHQVAGKNGYLFVADFEVVIDKEHLFETYELFNPQMDCEYTVKKVDQNGNALEGATFQMIDTDTGEVFAEKVSGSDGLATFTDIPFGNYKVIESLAAEGFERSELEISVAINENWKNLPVGEFNDILINYPSEYSVKKVDEAGNSLEGATFQMINIKTDEVVMEATSGSDGLATFKNLPFGTFKIIESAAPSSYELSDEVFTIVVDGTWRNKPVGEFDDILSDELCEYRVKKVDKFNNPLAGATFQLINLATDEVVAEATSDETGLAMFVGIKYGSYKCIESAAPSGFELSEVELHVTINSNWKNLPAGEFNDILVDEPNRYTVKKVDENGNALPDAVFQIIDAVTREVYGEATSDEAGLATFENLPFNDYLVIEVSAPKGYKLSKLVIPVTIDENWKNLPEGEFNDILENKPTEVEFEKLDFTNSEGVPGAEITIYNEDGSVYISGITDSEGKFKIYNIPVGKYTFKETYCPAGYQINTTIFEFEILADGTIVGDTTITDEPTEWTITKTDITGEKTLPGATIVIYDEQGNEVFRDVTAEDGTVTATYLKPGKYTFKEIYACDSYALNVGVFEFEIDENGNITGDDTITDELTKLEIFKTNELGEPMADVKFGVYDLDGNLVMEGTTDENGYLAFVGLAHNDYVVKEISTWDGYMLDPNSYAVKIDGEWVNGSDEAILNIINHPEIQTGDNSNILWPICFVFISVCGIAFFSRNKYSFGV